MVLSVRHPSSRGVLQGRRCPSPSERASPHLHTVHPVHAPDQTSSCWAPPQPHKSTLLSATAEHGFTAANQVQEYLEPRNTKRHHTDRPIFTILTNELTASPVRPRHAPHLAQTLLGASPCPVAHLHDRRCSVSSLGGGLASMAEAHPYPLRVAHSPTVGACASPHSRLHIGTQAPPSSARLARRPSAAGMPLGPLETWGPPALRPLQSFRHCFGPVVRVWSGAEYPSLSVYGGVWGWGEGWVCPCPRQRRASRVCGLTSASWAHV